MYMDYIVANLSGHQKVLEQGKWYDVDYIAQGVIGNFLSINKIMLFKKADKIQVGKPFLKTSEIPAQIIQQVKGQKITVLKTKPKKKYTRTMGNRQKYTRIRIESNILVNNNQN